MSLADIERLIEESTGLDPDSIGASAVERAVRQRQRACHVSSPDTYWHLLRDAPAELQTLIESLVVAETWFFRDGGAFAALTRFVHDEWLPSEPAGPLRMLSLPCASGEEPYSMAIAVLDAGLPAERFRIDAVDISERVLRHARDGVYGRGAFRGNPTVVRHRHFAPAGQGWRVSDLVRNQVRFHYGNLFSPSLLQEAEPYDVVFSRNLLIYFDRATRSRAIDVLSNFLSPNGILFVGPSETATLTDRGFVSNGTPKAFAFRKQRTRSPATARVVPIVPTHRVSRPMGSPATVQAIGGGTPPAKATDDARLAATSQPAALEEGTRLANEGRFEDAVQRCQESIEQHGPTADAFCLLGLIRDAMGNVLEAMSCYRKALYLDPRHENALVHLALLLEALGRAPEAQRLRTRARRAGLGSGA